MYILVLSDRSTQTSSSHSSSICSPHLPSNKNTIPDTDVGDPELVLPNDGTDCDIRLSHEGIGEEDEDNSDDEDSPDPNLEGACSTKSRKPRVPLPRCLIEDFECYLEESIARNSMHCTNM